MPKYYKCLTKENTGGYSGFRWPDPGVSLVPVTGELKMCDNGYHVCEAKDLLRWIDSGDVYEFIPEGDMISSDDKVCFRGGKLGDKVLDWRGQLLFQADVAQRVLHLFEDKMPNDKRVRDCIKAKRDGANGLDVDLDAARAAARAAARDVAWDVAMAAARAAAWAAAKDAARDVAGDAAWAAAKDAARDVAGDVEESWQLRQLKYRMGIYKTPEKGAE